MPATIQHDHGNLYRVQVSGLLRKAELENVQQTASEAIEHVGRINLLFILDQFEGFERDADWTDIDFYIRHDKDIDKIALVGEERWRDHAMTFAGAGIRKAAVEFFQTAQVVRAQVWLSH